MGKRMKNQKPEGVWLQEVPAGLCPSQGPRRAFRGFGTVVGGDLLYTSNTVIKLDTVEHPPSYSAIGRQEDPKQVQSQPGAT